MLRVCSVEKSAEFRKNTEFFNEHVESPCDLVGRMLEGVGLGRVVV